MWSEKCISSQYFDNERFKCMPCEHKFDIRAGYEFSPNCGRSDNGSQHEFPHTRCPDGKFNDGTMLYCKQCSTCSAGYLQFGCNGTSDSSCCVRGQCAEHKYTSEPLPTAYKMSTTTTTTTIPVSATTTTKSPVNAKTTKTSPVFTTDSIFGDGTMISGASGPGLSSTSGIGLGVNFHPATFWVVIILLCLCLACVFYIIKKRKRKSRGCKTHVNGLSFENKNTLTEHLTSREDSTDSHMHLLSAEIQAAPLQTVLNNLDVVEELVLLLDPETVVVKNTRHLAANCSLPFAWINYIYSMKEKRSPLVAVLEKVITSHPHWNVGHLADLLSKIGRNDAVAVLGKLTVSTEMV